jgi:putative heme-binding domain-containing protein
VDRSLEDLLGLLPDPAAARALARRGDRRAAPRLAAILESPDPAARFAAAEALAECGTPETLPALWKALEADPDRFLEHALVHAIHRVAPAETLEKALGHPHPRVRKTALLLLDQPPRAGAPLEALARAAADPDPDLRRAALGRLRGRRDGARAARRALEDGLRRPSAAGEERPALGDLIRAFEGDAGVREVAARAVRASEPGAPAVLAAIAESALSPPPAEWREALKSALEGPVESALASLRAVTALRLRDFDETLARLAAAGPRDLRRAALRALVEGRPRLDEEAFAFLLSELAPEADPAARLAAGEILSRTRLTGAQAARALRALRGDALLSPGLVLSGFRDAAGAVGELLAAMREAIEAGWRPSESELEALLLKLSPEARERAGPVREALGHAREDVRARLARFEALLSGGDPARGRDVFFGRRAGCGACHAVGQEGGTVGPDLTRIGAVRAGRDLLESILVPSATFAQGYEPYQARTADGDVFSGILARRTEEGIVLRDASGAETALPRRRIRDLRRGSVSIMPEGLERNLSEEEFRDLLAFLRSLR